MGERSLSSLSFVIHDAGDDTFLRGGERREVNRNLSAEAKMRIRI